jgi:hypothetical protein
MPNWCVNQLDVQGDEVEVARLIELVKGDQDAFDFAEIVPIPDSPYYAANEGQNDFLCGCKKVWVETKEQVGKYGEEGYENAEGHWEVNGLPIVKEVLNNGTIHDAVAQMFGGSDVCPTHKVGQISAQPDWWYNWNVANWGTKWNCGDVWHDRADDSVVEGKTSYNFDTAWSPAEPVVAALAEQFPTLSLTHRYCEGGMGFAGEVEYANGVEVERKDYGSGDDGLPDDAWMKGEDGKPEYGERDYDAVPQTEFEAFCEEHFGGVVGG